MKFRREIEENVEMLLKVLNKVFEDEFLSNRLCLKGGTALNLFWLDVPRMSVDLDFNYIGSLDREVTLSEKPFIHDKIRCIAESIGMHCYKIPTEHSGGKFAFTYKNEQGLDQALSIDINYIFRYPLFELKKLTSRKVGSEQAKNVMVLDFNEIVAGKICALLDRNKSRDIFDIIQIFKNSYENINHENLKVAMTVYIGLCRRIEEVLNKREFLIEKDEFLKMLYPLLDIDFQDINNVETYIKELKNDFECAFNKIPKLTESQKQFLFLLEQEGEMKPHLVSDNREIQEKISKQPGLLWKAKNVQDFRRKSPHK